MPVQLPAVTSEILTTRYQMHRRIVEKTENFLWLLDTCYSTPPGTVHPLDLPESSTLQLNSAGNLIVSRSSVNRLASTESVMYCGSHKSWISPLASFSLINPEKCRRLVSHLFFILYSESNLSLCTLVCLLQKNCTVAMWLLFYESFYQILLYYSYVKAFCFYWG